MAYELPKRLPRNGAAELEAAVTGHEFYRLTPDETWHSKWALWPAGAPRGPFRKPTRTILHRVMAGVEKRLNCVQ
ncbi:hypothetical protein ACFYYH_11325 [Streptomyces sp. NPDC002018]|uniref:hypothetical protein n=1 Tax=Streptomyces sp. NPDC002018 TaxID=3364629 RepID=UPI0036A6B70C